MSCRSFVIAALALHAAAGCRMSSEIPLTVTFVRHGSGAGVQSSGGLARVPSGAPVRFTIEVRNASAGASTIDDVLAVVINADGEVLTRSVVSPRRRVHRGKTVTFRQSLEGPWRDDAVLGVAARFDGQQAHAGVCTPLCPGCDSVRTQRACERLDLLLKSEQTRPSAVGTRQREGRPPDLQVPPTRRPMLAARG